MPYQVRYAEMRMNPETGQQEEYEWFATFATEEEAMAQAAMDTHVYGGVSPQEILDDNENVVQDQEAIVAEAEKLQD